MINFHFNATTTQIMHSPETLHICLLGFGTNSIWLIKYSFSKSLLRCIYFFMETWSTCQIIKKLIGIFILLLNWFEQNHSNLLKTFVSNITLNHTTLCYHIILFIILLLLLSSLDYIISKHLRLTLLPNPLWSIHPVLVFPVLLATIASMKYWIPILFITS